MFGDSILEHFGIFWNRFVSTKLSHILRFMRIFISSPSKRSGRLWVSFCRLLGASGASKCLIHTLRMLRICSADPRHRQYNGALWPCDFADGDLQTATYKRQLSLQKEREVSLKQKLAIGKPMQLHAETQRPMRGPYSCDILRVLVRQSVARSMFKGQAMTQLQNGFH